METPSRVITVYGAKGGIGKTFIAANIAAALRQSVETALIELDGSGDARSMLGSVAVTFEPKPANSAALVSVVQKMSAQHAFTIIDAGTLMTDLAVSAFEQSNLILLVTTPDAISIRRSQEAIESFKSLKLASRMVGVVINRAESRGNLRSIEVKAELSSATLLAEVPSDGRLAGLAVNHRTPIVKIDEPSRIKDAFKRIAKVLIESTHLYSSASALDHSTAVGAPKTSEAASLRSPAQRSAAQSSARLDEPTESLMELKRKIHTTMLERFDLKRIDLKSIDDPKKAAQLREGVKEAAMELVLEEIGSVSGSVNRELLVKDIVDEALGLGPLEDLLADPDVSDILVNGKDRVYVERRGKLALTNKRFLSNDQVRVIIERIVAPLGRRIDESSPMVDARLLDGSRVNAIIPPLSITGPILSIRKFSRERYTMEELIARFGTLSKEMSEFLQICVRARKNIIVSGGTGSGKTTLLNALSTYIPEDERIITIEDAAELRLSQEHWVPLEARPQNIEGKGGISVRQLFRNTLRMRPDRIIIGECRSDETLDMLQAMNTGHDGSMTTIHANSPSDVISRMDSLVLMSQVDLPVKAIREQISSAVHLIVHSARLSDGTRKMTYITELTGIDAQANIIMKDIFVFKQQGVGPNGEVQGAFVPTGEVPSFFKELLAKGLPINESLFRPSH